jgi:hypothetical protein
LAVAPEAEESSVCREHDVSRSRDRDTIYLQRDKRAADGKPLTLTPAELRAENPRRLLRAIARDDESRKTSPCLENQAIARQLGGVS